MTDPRKELVAMYNKNSDFKKSVVYPKALKNLNICGFCGQKNGSKMFVLHFSANRKIRAHSYCISDVGGMREAIRILEEKMPFYFEIKKAKTIPIQEGNCP